MRMNDRTRCEYLYNLVYPFVKQREPFDYEQPFSSDSDLLQTSVVSLVLIVNKTLATLVQQ